MDPNQFICRENLSCSRFTMLRNKEIKGLHCNEASRLVNLLPVLLFSFSDTSPRTPRCSRRWYLCHSRSKAALPCPDVQSGVVSHNSRCFKGDAAVHCGLFVETGLFVLLLWWMSHWILMFLAKIHLKRQNAWSLIRENTVWSDRTQNLL